MRLPPKEQLAAFVFLVMLGVVHHYFFYPPVVEERRTGDSLNAIANAVSTQNEARVRDEVMHYLADDAKIRLELTYTALETAMEADANGEANRPAIVYEFTKPMFRAYLTHMLRSLKQFHFRGQVAEFHINPDWNTARATVASSGSAVGKSRFVTRLLDARFSYDAACDVWVSLGENRPMARNIRCRMFLPRPEPLS